MARIFDGMKSVAGKLMANPYDKPGMDSVKMSATGEVRAYVPPQQPQQRVKRPAQQPTSQQTVNTARQAPVPPQQPAEGRQGFLGGLFKRNQQPMSNTQYTGNQPPMANAPYTGNQPPMANAPYTGNQPPMANAPYTGNQPPMANAPYTGNQPPMANAPYTGNQPPMNNTQYTGGQQPFNTVFGGKKAAAGSIRDFFGHIFGTSKMKPQTETPSVNNPAGWQQPGQVDTGRQPPVQSNVRPMNRPAPGAYTGSGTAARQPGSATGFGTQQPMQGWTGSQNGAQQPMQSGPVPTGNPQQVMEGGYIPARPQQTAQPVRGFGSNQPQPGRPYFSGQQQVQTGSPRPVEGWFHGTQGNGQQPVNAPYTGSQQTPPQSATQSAPDNVSYMNAGNFVDKDGRAYATVMCVAQPVSTATCYRVIEFIRRGEAVLVNTELMTDSVELTRSLDLLFGAAYAMHACYTRVAQRSLYLITPTSVKVRLYPSLNELHQRDNARRWPGSEPDNRQYYDDDPQPVQGYNRERHRRSGRAY